MSLSRRAYLSVATLAASSMAVARTSGVSGWDRVTSKFGLSSAEARTLGVLASDLEVITVTDTSVAFTWATYAPGVQTAYGFAKPTVAAHHEVLMAPADGGPMQSVAEGYSPSGYHYVEVSGLEPDREYRFECWSEGARAVPSIGITMGKNAPERRGVVKTLPPLLGRHLATIALTNDTHIGKPNHDGIRFGNFGLASQPGEQHFASMQLEGLLHTVAREGIEHIVVNGDCTDSNLPIEYDEFIRIMNGFGEFGQQWFVTRGNHDLHPPGLPNINGSRGRDVRKGKVEVPDYFGGRLVPTQTHWTHQVGEVRLLGIDSSEFGYVGGRINADQMASIEADLAADPDRPTLMFAHHPITTDAALSHIGGANFMMETNQALHLQRVISQTPGVKGVFAGHTHRSRRGKADFGTADYCERGASLGYPGGYTKIVVHTDGYQVSFQRTATEQSLQWSTKTRWSIFGLEPELILGRVTDRNYVQWFRNQVRI